MPVQLNIQTEVSLLRQKSLQGAALVIFAPNIWFGLEQVSRVHQMLQPTYYAAAKAESYSLIFNVL